MEATKSAASLRKQIYNWTFCIVYAKKEIDLYLEVKEREETRSTVNFRVKTNL